MPEKKPSRAIYSQNLEGIGKRRGLEDEYGRGKGELGDGRAFLWVASEVPRAGSSGMAWRRA